MNLHFVQSDVYNLKFKIRQFGAKIKLCGKTWDGQIECHNSQHHVIFYDTIAHVTTLSHVLLHHHTCYNTITHVTTPSHMLQHHHTCYNTMSHLLTPCHTLWHYHTPYDIITHFMTSSHMLHHQSFYDTIIHFDTITHITTPSRILTLRGQNEHTRMQPKVT